MKSKIIYLVTGILLLWSCQSNKSTSKKAIPTIALEKSAVKAEIDGTIFRDLNKNGSLDIYEDINAPIESRVEDLLSQMTLEEKAGAMFMPGVPVNEDGTLKKKT